MNALFVVAGLVVVAVTLLDAFDTLVSTRIRSGRWWPTEIYYRTTWKLWRRICASIDRPGRREEALSLFGPMSLAGLLIGWTVGQVGGWSLVWWGAREGFSLDFVSYVDAVYYSGVTYLTIGFGDILPREGALRILTLCEALGGLGTLGLLIGFLPALYAAYQDRERQLLRLDDLTETRVTPASLARSHLAHGGLAELERLFDEWSAWCANLFETHTSFPMLVLFRSQHPGQSWVTALGVVNDTAIFAAATIEGADGGPAMRLHRQAVRTIGRLAERVGVTPVPYQQLPQEWYQIGYGIVSDLGLPLRSPEEACARVNELRSEFHPYMEGFIDELLAPRGFWGLTSADEMHDIDTPWSPPASA